MIYFRVTYDFLLTNGLKEYYFALENFYRPILPVEMKAKVILMSFVLISLALVYAVKGILRLAGVMMGRYAEA